MSKIAPVHLLAIAAAFLTATPVSSQAPKPHPLVMPLQCPQGECPLLKGSPQTAGMRSGFVRLKPGQTVGWHSTGKNEETLVILHGRGEARIARRLALPFVAPALVYIPPATRHNVADTGEGLLEYEYVVAPVKTP